MRSCDLSKKEREKGWCGVGLEKPADLCSRDHLVNDWQEEEFECPLGKKFESPGNGCSSYGMLINT